MIVEIVTYSSKLMVKLAKAVRLLSLRNATLPSDLSLQTVFCRKGLNMKVQYTWKIYN